MKLRVVGWTDYDDDLEQGELGWAARHAIIDDIKAHGYLFSGWAHQEAYGCTPVLNDGKMYCYSQRSWGGIMAEAHGYLGRMDYAMFAFAGDRATEIRPKEGFNEDDFEPESALRERFELEVPQAAFDSAQKELKIKLEDSPAFRYLDTGDILALSCGGKTAEFTVADVDRKPDLPEDELNEIWMAHYGNDPERTKRAEEKLASAKLALTIQLKKRG